MPIDELAVVFACECRFTGRQGYYRNQSASVGMIKLALVVQSWIDCAHNIETEDRPQQQRARNCETNVNNTRPRCLFTLELYSI